ncbi:hypothetical protein [Aeromicrobium fastidiosum]|uniref:Uncharacterized protein n=1 Tax=Aeromicrobium fastidiosum TaxID=52699 RepID=A0A641AUK3_9ACTN|nr:hypothetical protein [Aeromicrobium fastidiosum]KAA1380528.1 hypothetical protein ESP62_004950 [Aeromicrobium fastidiosum]MBP2390120.1 F0F1-type ATP synthase membrane subunit c/vacuolar-type H+-ATPase subunit K [Aeromicrobium fastidiosum]
MTIPPLRTFRKAIAGGLATAAAAIGTSCTDGNLTGPELVAGVGLGLVAGATVYLTPRNASS